MNELQKYQKRIDRAGLNLLNNIFKPYRDVSYFDGRKNLLEDSDCLFIFNTIGINISIIYLLAISNGLDGIDEEGFKKLLDEQKKKI